MAIHKNLWLRNTKQRLAGVVFYNRAGETVSRELAAKVSNPRSAAQMSQRVKLANLVALYRANKAWMRDSAFESKPRNWSEYNALIHYNIDASDVALTKDEAAAGVCVAETIQVTRGSLPAISFDALRDGSGMGTDLYVGPDFNIQTASTTVGNLSQVLLTYNNGLQNGMQISLVYNYQMTNTSTGLPYVVARYYEFIINTESNVLLYNTDFGKHVDLVSEGEDDAAVKFTADADSSIWAGAVILSHTVGGKTYVSDAAFALNSFAVYAQYTSAAHAAEATASYGSKSYDFLSTAPGNNDGSNSGVGLSLGIVSVAGVGAGGTLNKSRIATDHQIVLTGPLSTSGDASVYEITYVLDNDDDLITSSGFSVNGNVINAPAKNISSTAATNIKRVDIEYTTGQGDTNPIISIDFQTPIVDGDGSQTE